MQRFLTPTKKHINFVESRLSDTISGSGATTSDKTKEILYCYASIIFLQMTINITHGQYERFKCASTTKGE